MLTFNVKGRTMDNGQETTYLQPPPLIRKIKWNGTWQLKKSQELLMTLAMTMIKKDIHIILNT